MSKRFILSESERKEILSQYSLLLEGAPSVNPNAMSVEQWVEWSNSNIIPYVNNLKKEKNIPLDKRKGKDVYTRLSDPTAFRDLMEVSPKRDTPAVSVFNSLMRSCTIPSNDEYPEQRGASYANFQTLQNFKNDFMSIWNDPQYAEKKIVFEMTRSEELVQQTPVRDEGFVNLLITWDNKDYKNLYKDNSWEIAEALKESFKTNVLDSITESKKQFPKASYTLESMTVKTSCSRLRNSGDAANLSFKELSEARARTAAIYMLDELKKYGVLNSVYDNKIVKTETDGKNGDGTSGPNPPVGLRYIPRGQEKMEPAAPDETNRNDFGKPLDVSVQDIMKDTPNPYDEFKYLIVEIKLKAKYSEPTTSAPKFRVESFTYSISVDDKKLKEPPVIERPGGSGPKPPGGGNSNLLKRIFTKAKTKCAAYD